MKSFPFPRSPNKGSALITVTILIGVMALVTGSMLTYTMSERRGNERNRLILRANTMAENITDYAADQLTTKLFRLGSAPVGVFPWTGTSINKVVLPPSSILDNPPYTSSSTAEMRTGILTATGYTLVNDTSDPNNGLQVATALVPIVAKVTGSHPALGNYTAYVEQDMALTLTPLFQFGMFYNMDLELYPSQAFTLSGPVHTNNRLMAHPDGSQTIAITFTDRVTSAGGVYADSGIKVVPRGGSGTPNPMTPSTGDIYFTHTDGVTQVSMKDTDLLWRDQKYKTATETTTTDNQFKVWATNTYNGNLRTNVHGVTKLELPGIGSYLEQDDPGTPGDDRSNGRQIIEPPNAKVWVWNALTHTGAWTSNTDDASLKQTKLSWKAGLYIIVNPDDNIRSCTIPDGTIQFLLPFSYRAFLNTVNTSGVNSIAEVVLPGQPTYGYNNGPDAIAGTGDDYMYTNYLPNRYATNTSAGANQVVRIPQQGYGVGAGYLIHNAGGYAIGATTLAIDTGSGTIVPGDTVTISSPSTTTSYSYVVASTSPAAGTITVAAPGLRAAVADNDPITVDWASNIPGSGMGYVTNGARAIGATSIAVKTGSGTLLAGNILTIAAKKYVVATTLAAGVVIINSPGLVAAVGDNTPVTLDAMGGTVGTGTGYLINHGGTYAIGTTDLTLDTGSGSILPGNSITIGSFKYLVASALSSTVVRIAAPGLRATVADNDVVTVDAASGTLGTGVNYVVNGAALINATNLNINTGSGTIRPGNVVAVGNYKYMVASTPSPVPAAPTAITIVGNGTTNGLLEAVANNTLVIVDPFQNSGYSRTGYGGMIYPADSGAVNSLVPAPAYFYDMRRANSNRGVIALSGTTALYDRYTVPYVPRPCAKIDFDVARFHMMFDRVISGSVTSTGYDLRAPSGSGVWVNSIFNPSATTLPRGLGLGLLFDVLPTPGTGAVNAPDPFQLYYVPTNPDTNTTITAIGTDPRSYAVPAGALTTSGACPWYDGIAIYLHSVDAEIRNQTVFGTPDRTDSGVRMWNGRGPAPSLTASGKTGFTFITNDPVYIVGHYNADGNINTTTTATGYGGYSSRYPDSASEKLCAIMGDAIITLSQPVWTDAGSGQTSGWSDALSALPSSATSAGWRTGSSPTDTLTGSFDGVYVTTGPKPGLLPTDHDQNTAIAAASATKLGALDTEMSTCLLVGIVPSNASPGYVSSTGSAAVTDGFVPTWTHSATGDPLVIGNRVNAGGANNFPRLLENWQPGGNRKNLFIRGSMVALFESRVAMEPFTNSRSYNAPGRFWGLHDSLRTANHDVPLEPIVLGSSRVGFRQLTAAQYATQKTMLEALPPLP